MRRVSKLLYFYPAKVLGEDQGVQYLGFKRLLALFSILFFQGTMTSKNPSFCKHQMVTWIGLDYFMFSVRTDISNSIEIPISNIYYTFTFHMERLLCETAFLKLVTVYYDFEI